MALNTSRDVASTFLPELLVQIEGKTRTNVLLFHGTGKKKKIEWICLDVLLFVGNRQSSALVRFDIFYYWV